MQHKFLVNQYKLAYFFHFCNLRARFPCLNSAQKRLQLFYSNTNKSIKNEQKEILRTPQHWLRWKCSVESYQVLMQNFFLYYLLAVNTSST